MISRGSAVAARIGARGLVVAGTVAALAGLGIVAAPGGTAGATSTDVLSGVSCFGKVCYIVGTTNASGGTALIEKTNNGGSTWTKATVPSTAAVYNAVSCVTSTGCTAVGGDASGNPQIAVSPATGKIWTAQTAPAADAELFAVSCKSSTQCWAGGYAAGFTAGAVAETTNGGSTWSPESVPGGSTGVTSVLGLSCKGSPVIDCWGAGTWTNYQAQPYLMTSNSNKTSWKTVYDPAPAGGSMNGVSCFSTKSCVAVGDATNAAYIVDYNGTTYTPVAAPTGFVTFNGVSCVTGSTTCIAVGLVSGGGAGIAISTNSGATWTAQTAPSGVGALSAVSCYKTTVCMAVGTASAGGPAVIATANGTTWNLETTPS
jgi:hypothetical protein